MFNKKLKKAIALHDSIMASLAILNREAKTNEIAGYWMVTIRTELGIEL